MASRMNDNNQTNTYLLTSDVRSAGEHLDRFCDENMWLLGGWIYDREEKPSEVVRQTVSFPLKSAANSDR